MKKRLGPKASAAEVFPSPELLPPAAIAGKPWLKKKPSSRASIPPKGSLRLELGKEKSEFEFLGLIVFLCLIDVLRLRIGVCGS